MAGHKIRFLAKIARKQRLDQNIAVWPAAPSPFLMRIALIESGHSHLSIRANLVKHGVVEIVIRQKPIIDCNRFLHVTSPRTDMDGRTDGRRADGRTPDAGRTDTIIFVHRGRGLVFLNNWFPFQSRVPSRGHFNTKSHESPQPCLLYTSPSPRDRG